MYIRNLYNFSLRHNKVASLIRYDLFARICDISEEKIDDKTDEKTDEKAKKKAEKKAEKKAGENTDDY